MKWSVITIFFNWFFQNKSFWISRYKLGRGCYCRACPAMVKNWKRWKKSKWRKSQHIEKCCNEWVKSMGIKVKECQKMNAQGKSEYSGAMGFGFKLWWDVISLKTMLFVLRPLPRRLWDTRKRIMLYVDSRSIRIARRSHGRFSILIFTKVGRKFLTSSRKVGFFEWESWNMRHARS